MRTRKGGYLSLDSSTTRALATLKKSLNEVIETVLTEDEMQKLCVIWGTTYSGHRPFDAQNVLKLMQTQPSFFKHLLGSFAVATLSAAPAVDVSAIMHANQAYAEGQYTNYANIRMAHAQHNQNRAQNPMEALKLDATIGAMAAIPVSILMYGASRLTGYYKDSHRSAATIDIIQGAIRRESKKPSPRKSHRSPRTSHRSPRTSHSRRRRR
jgi:hypothetical protein